VLPDVLVADANVILSATIAGRARDVLVDAEAPRVVAAREVGAEVLEHLPRLAERRGLALGPLLLTFAALPIDWIEPAEYVAYEEEARRRMSPRDEDDWPTLALALSLAGSRRAAIWTQDKDFDVSGFATMSTGEVLDALRTLSR
jgi:predicted nucleic acid-binding protein